jgi:hypothetical protein
MLRPPVSETARQGLSLLMSFMLSEPVKAGTRSGTDSAGQAAAPAEDEAATPASPSAADPSNKIVLDSPVPHS